MCHFYIHNLKCATILILTLSKVGGWVVSPAHKICQVSAQLSLPYFCPILVPILGLCIHCGSHSGLHIHAHLWLESPEVAVRFGILTLNKCDTPCHREPYGLPG